MYVRASVVVIGAEGEASSETPVAVQPIDVVPRRAQSNMNVCVDAAVGATNPKCSVFGPSIIVNGCSNSQDAVSVPVGQAMRYVVASCLSVATGYATTGYARLNKSAVVTATVAVPVLALTASRRSRKGRKFKDSGVDRNISFLDPVAIHADACPDLPNNHRYQPPARSSKAKPKFYKFAIIVGTLDFNITHPRR